MSAWLSVILVILLLAGLFWWRRQTAKTVVSASSKSPGKSFHGVSIRPTSGACRAVQAIANKRFLTNEAPSLPLSNCDVSYCGCRYEHHQDRHAHIDRRHIHVDIETQASGKEQRKQDDRRQGRK